MQRDRSVLGYFLHVPSYQVVVVALNNRVSIPAGETHHIIAAIRIQIKN